MNRREATGAAAPHVSRTKPPLMRVCTVSQMRSLDQAAIERFGIPEALLMENAGLAAFEAMRRHYTVAGKNVVVVAGTGNNGGDGFVVARKVLSAGGNANIAVAGEISKIQGTAKLNLDIASSMGIPIIQARQARDLENLMATSDILVDALFGTGLARDVEGLPREVIEMVNASGKPVISLDIPSGIHGDTGRVMGCAVKADITVSFGLPKTGNLLAPGSTHCGKLFVSHISFSPSLYNDESLKVFVNEPCPLPARDPSGHKGVFGEALIISGAKGYYGAPSLASLSFLKAGGGYARLAAPESVVPHLAALCPETVFHPMAQTGSGSLAQTCEAAILELASRADFVVMGPGMSLDAETQSLVIRLASRIEKPLLIDGDGITAISSSLSCIKNRRAPTVLTPHPGEMARLTGMPVSSIEADRITVIRRTAQDLNAVVVLKGHHSLVGGPEGDVAVNMSGNDGMATPGSGDVLAGIIAAMVCQGQDLFDAVRTGVFIHGACGDLAASRLGRDGMTAWDIMEALPETVRLHREGVLAPKYRIEVI